MTLLLSPTEAVLVADALRTRVRTLGPQTEAAELLRGVLGRMGEIGEKERTGYVGGLKEAKNDENVGKVFDMTPKGDIGW